ncbi:hypothetical protein GLOTRDRAFT_126336 [Gloeophyllum trabeum ATCC 11539]|uniref:Uncharacterized protein n=1 Tax=Gloeophyllum trabeum (strain ATCC 11539 / FP-39264 / Madison 617) TaxID=670483 RepID=S7RT31_GLOTA|nr:uncharacterized protein GLOTRDRAFT_126336 [Gloeophyllum trabeum ATCC 11539]EPQ57845.1 hypothetical protein GLOTRDRAFT_126336 [Gloeophyllum trabeum ATCC 11539]
MVMSTPSVNMSLATRRWQPQPVPRSHHVLGFLIKEDIVNRTFLPQLLPREYGLTNQETVLVYVDEHRMKMAHALVLADNRRRPKQREPPPPEVVDKIADDLGLEGDAREPVWYKCVY